MALKRIGVLLLPLLFLLAQFCGAAESGPSNTVGFWKLDVQHGYTQISFPLLPGNKTVNNVLGDQLTGGNTSQESDQILRWDPASGQFQMCWYNTAVSEWEGEFNELSEAESYWIYVQPDHPSIQTIITFGNVIETVSFDMGRMTPGYNAIGSVWAVTVPILQAGLDGFEGGLYLFLSDLIMSYDAYTGSYTYTWQDDSNDWQGNLTQFEPLKGYWIYIPPGHDGFEWSNYPQPIPPGSDGFTTTKSNPTTYTTELQPSKIPELRMPPFPNTVKTNKKIKSPAQSTSKKGGAQ